MSAFGKFHRNFIVNRKITKISRFIYFENFSGHRFEDFSAQINRKKFFFKKKFFQGLGAFLTNAKPLIWGLFFLYPQA